MISKTAAVIKNALDQEKGSDNQRTIPGLIGHGSLTAAELAAIGYGGKAIYDPFASGALTGRKSYFHGTTDETKKKILSNGLLGAKSETSERLRNLEKGFDKTIDPKKYRNKIYLSENPEYAKEHANTNQRWKDIDDAYAKKTKPIDYYDTRAKDNLVEARLPKDYVAKHRVENPETAMGWEKYDKLNESIILKDDDKIRKKLFDQQKSHLVIEGDIPAKYIKGSPHYRKPGVREISRNILGGGNEVLKGLGRAGLGAGLMGISAYDMVRRYRDRNPEPFLSDEAKSKIFDVGLNSLEGGAIPIGVYNAFKPFTSGDLTGRKTLYHGTTENAADSIREQGLFPTTDENAVTTKRLKNSGTDAYEKSLGKSYLSPKRSLAAGNGLLAVRESIGDSGIEINDNAEFKKRMFSNKGMVKANVPLWKMKEVTNPEVDMSFDKWRGNLPFDAKVMHDDKDLKKIYDKLKNDVVAIEGGVPSRYIKGSKNYQRLGIDELRDYIANNRGRFLKGLGRTGMGLGLTGLSIYDLIRRNKSKNREGTME